MGYAILMRATIYLMENNGNDMPVCIVLVTDAEYRDYEHLRDTARRAKSERYDFRPGILFACVSGCSIISLE